VNPRAVGHSLGTGLHDFPELYAAEEAELKADMVVNIELAVTDSRKWTYHVEDTVLVTVGEPRVVTTAMDADSLFVIK
jgi:Xaa-Pro aminopeptidase